MAAAQAAQKPWRFVRLDLILMRRVEKYMNSNLNPLTKFTSSQSLKILPWNISRMITKIIKINTRIVISYANMQI